MRFFSGVKRRLHSCRIRFILPGLLTLLLISGGGCANEPPPPLPPLPPLPPSPSPAPRFPSPVPTLTPAARSTATPVVYTVQPGDTLFSIARQFGTTVEALVEANNLEDANVIREGQSLRIPTVPSATEAGR